MKNFINYYNCNKSNIGNELINNDKDKDNRNNKSNDSTFKNFDSDFKLWNKRLTILNVKCGFLSGIFTGTLFFPLDNIRIRLMSSQNIIKYNSKNSSNYKNTNANFYKNKNLRSTFFRIMNKEGIKGFYVGFWLTILKESIASSLYFSFFEYNINNLQKEGKLVHLSYKYYFNTFLIGASAGLLNWTVTLPLDILRTKIISDKILNHCKNKYKNTYDCAIQIITNQGFKGFYVGYKVMVLRSMIVNGFVLCAFDALRNKFNLK